MYNPSKFEQNILYISFENYQVALCSNVIEVLTEIKRSFKAMLQLEKMTIISQLEVLFENGKYYLIRGENISVTTQTLNDILSSIKHEIILRLIQARPDLLWLHAGAAVYQNRAVIFSGLSGRGKSTLVTNLCTKGWTYLSDDILPLDLISGKAFPFPQTPKVRENLGQELSHDQVQKLNKIVVDLKPEVVCRKPMPIVALILPTYSINSPTQILSYSSTTAALELLQNCLNFINHKQAAIRYVSELIKHVPIFRLSFSNADLASEIIVETYNNLF